MSAAASALIAVVATLLLALGVAPPVWIVAFLLAVITGVVALVSAIAQAVSHTGKRAARGTEHFVAKARGQSRAAEVADLFVGRRAALTDLINWLTTSDPQARLCVVTGGPGCGKSAIIGRLVAESDPRLRRTLRTPQSGVPVGAIQAVIHARNLILSDVENALVAQFNLRGADLADIALAVGRCRPIIVIDALDEANGEDEGHRIAQLVIRPLVEAGARVLVGVRKRAKDDLSLALGVHRQTVDLDSPTYFESQDVTDYVASLLGDGVGESSQRFRVDRALTLAVAGEIATRAGHSFLVARLIARSVAVASAPPSVRDPSWHAGLPGTIADAMEAYVARLATAADRWRARDLLTALALAEGDGLPYDRHIDLWSVCASALGPATYDTRDIQWLLASRVADLIDGPNGSPGTYRLFHAELATYLRPSGTHLETLQAAIARALAASAPARWEGAAAYLTSHLATHAAQGDLLDSLLEDTRYVIVADPARLLRAMSTPNARSAALVRSVYHLAFSHLLRCPPNARASYLELAGRQMRATGLADAIARSAPDRPWVTSWAVWQPSSPHYVLGRHRDSVRQIATGTSSSGRPLAVSWAGKEAVVWDLETGLVSGDPLDIGTGHRVRLAVGVLDGRPIAITSDASSHLTTWDLEQGQPSGPPFAQHVGAIRALALTEVSGQPVVVSVDEMGLRVWDLHARIELRPPTPVGHETSALAAGVYDSHPLVACVSDHELSVLDLRQRAWLMRGSRIFQDDTYLATVALATVSNTVVALCGGDNDGFVMWDVRRNEQVGTVMWHPEMDDDDGNGVLAIAVCEIDGRPAALSGGDMEWNIRVWDLEMCTQRQPLAGHDSDIHAVATAVVRGRPVAVSGGTDASVRVWDLGTPTSDLEPFDGHQSPVRAVAASTVGGQDVVVSCDRRGLHVRDLETGRLVFPPVASSTKLFGFRLAQIDDELVAITIAKYVAPQVVILRTGATVAEVPCSRNSALLTDELDDRPVLLTGDRKLSLWDLRRLEQVWSSSGATALAELRVSALASATVGGTRVVLVGEDNGMISSWDLRSGEPTEWSVHAHEGSAAIVAGADASGRPVAVSGGRDGVRIWDLEAGERIGELPPLELGPVSCYALTSGAQPLVVVAGSHDPDGTCTVFDLATLERRTSFTVGSVVLRLRGDGRGAVLIATRAGLARVSIPAVS